jgi:hypothetical protein
MHLKRYRDKVTKVKTKKNIIEASTIDERATKSSSKRDGRL